VAKLMTQGYELLDAGRYVLEVVEAEAVNEYGPQLRLKLRGTTPKKTACSSSITPRSLDSRIGRRIRHTGYFSDQLPRVYLHAVA
jgi:hypothetical protein